MSYEDLEQVKDWKPNVGRAAYYNACLAVLCASFAQVSEAVQGTPLPESFSQPNPIDVPRQPTPEMPGATTSGAWHSGGENGMPSSMMEGVGFHLVETQRLVHVILIAFQWQETGDEIYVYSVDLRTYFDEGYAVGFVNTIVLSHVLEKARPQWYERARLYRISGLSFLQ